jgi:5-methylcytosine-specific restriction enzyme subunit McrC
MLQLESGVSGEVSPALVSSVRGDLLEFMIFQLATRLRRQLDHGAPRRYFEHSEDLETIRGRVDLGRLSRIIPGGRIRVPVKHSPLQRDNNLSRMVRATIAALYSKTRVWSTRKLLSSCDSSLIDVRLYPLTLDLIESAEPNMLEEDWRWVYEIALLFSGDRRTDPLSAGSEDQFSIIFSLHGLFERAVRRVFAGHLPGGLCLSVSKSIGYLMSALPSGNRLLNLQPDLVFGRGGPPLLIGDAKWRVRKSDSIGRNDAYQLASYMFHSNAEAGVLFYPSESPISGGVKVVSYKYNRDGRAFNVVEIDVEKMCGNNKIVRAEISFSLRQLIVDMAHISKIVV